MAEALGAVHTRGRELLRGWWVMCRHRFFDQMAASVPEILDGFLYSTEPPVDIHQTTLRYNTKHIFFITMPVGVDICCLYVKQATNDSLQRPGMKQCALTFLITSLLNWYVIRLTIQWQVILYTFTDGPNTETIRINTIWSCAKAENLWPVLLIFPAKETMAMNQQAQLQWNAVGVY
jgi:hypothetical protein